MHMTINIDIDINITGVMCAKRGLGALSKFWAQQYTEQHILHDGRTLTMNIAVTKECYYC